jgi:hypothetical protein
MAGHRGAYEVLSHIWTHPRLQGSSFPIAERMPTARIYPALPVEGVAPPGHDGICALPPQQLLDLCKHGLCDEQALEEPVGPIAPSVHAHPSHRPRGWRLLCGLWPSGHCRVGLHCKSAHPRRRTVGQHASGPAIGFARGQQDPGHASRLVRVGHTGAVRPASGLDALQPPAPPVRFSLHPLDDGPRTMNEACAQVGLATLADPESGRLAPTGMLARDKAQPGRQLAPMLERGGIAHRGD